MKKLLAFLLFLFSMQLAQSQEMKDFLPPASLIFDVGAHIGSKTDHYLVLGARHIVCVEPQPSCIDQLQKKYAHHMRVTVVPFALSYEEGYIPFFINSQSPAISTAAKEWQEGRFKAERWDRQAIVFAITLDSLINQHGIPDFCKIDVEGYEESVLKGLSHPIPYLSFEFTYEFLEKKTLPCLNHLIQLGYTQFNVAFGESEVFAFENWVSFDVLWDLLIHHPDHLSWGDIYAYHSLRE